MINLAKIVGGVMLGIGVAFVALFVWASYKTAVLDRAPDLGAFATLGVLGVLAAAFVAFWVVLLRDGASTELQITAATSVASSVLFCHLCLAAARARDGRL